MTATNMASEDTRWFCQTHFFNRNDQNRANDGNLINAEMSERGRLSDFYSKPLAEMNDDELRELKNRPSAIPIHIGCLASLGSIISEYKK
jgi:hypothetical protein